MRFLFAVETALTACFIIVFRVPRVRGARQPVDRGDTGLGCRADTPHPPNPCCMVSDEASPVPCRALCMYPLNGIERLLEGVVSLPRRNARGLLSTVMAATQWAPTCLRNGCSKNHATIFHFKAGKFPSHPRT